MKAIGLIGLLFIGTLAFGCNDESSQNQGGSGGSGGNSTSATSGGSAGAGVGGSTSSGETFDIIAALTAIPGMEIESDNDTPAGHFFDLLFEQPADHNNPNGQTFKQRISLIHRDVNAPMVLGSTGYALWVYEMEPTALLDANQLIVEHRFFTPSRPDPADWTTLRIAQAAADHHRIVEALKPIYGAKWISTGASKGGMTSVYHRRFYPNDVDGTVAYVAPQSYGDADPRYVDFLNSVGDAACRSALQDLQVEILKRRPAMIALAEAQAGANTYNALGLDGAFDFAVMSLPFAFWQYQKSSLCASVPPVTGTDSQLWDFLDKVSAVDFYNDELFYFFEPYYYQAGVELGYPGSDYSHLDGLLTLPLDADRAKTFVEPGPTKDIVLNPDAMIDIANWLAAEGTKTMFIYGEYDPYSAAAFELGNAADSYRFFVPGGNHGSEISDLLPADQQVAMNALGSWAGQMPKSVPPERLADDRNARSRRFFPHR
ncbi:MAG: aminopeptidase [Polyangiaceae bacterium]|nr:aminopeptidase [Polyangiaceae bacterium]